MFDDDVEGRGGGCDTKRRGLFVLPSEDLGRVVPCAGEVPDALDLTGAGDVLIAGFGAGETLPRVAVFDVAIRDFGVCSFRTGTAGDALGAALVAVGLSFLGVNFDTPTGLYKNGDEERREEMDFVGERGPTAFFCVGDDLAGVGVFLGVGGDLGTV